MKTLVMLGLMTVTALAPVAVGQDECVHTFEDPATITVVDLTAVGLGYYYVVERDSAVPNSPPIPGSGFLTGNGTWIYEESNGLFGTLERGGVGLFGDWFPPGCDQTPLEEGDVVWQDPATPFLIDDSNADPTQWTVDPTWVNYWHVDPSGSVGVPCLIIDEDPINDDACVAGVHYGPDTLIL